MGLVFITTAAGIVEGPLLKNLAHQSNNEGEITITFTYCNTSEIEFYLYRGENQLELLHTLHVGEVNIWATTSVSFSGFSDGQHKFRIIAKDSDGNVKVVDPYYIYVNLIEN